MSFNKILVFDGGVGTELYERGFYINRPFEELNLNAPAEVIAVHKAYISAGADVITTNTFSIAKHQLRKFDIESQQSAIVHAALANARKAVAGTSAQIAFSMGPLGELVEPLGSTALSEARDEYQSITKLCVKAGAPDFYILETFTNVDEMLAAITGIQMVDAKTPIIASMALRSAQDEKLADFALRVGELKNVEALGINCSEGPSDLLSTLKKLVALTKKPIVCQPNAGLPRNINGRYFYMTSPDYLGKYARRYLELGAAGVGGCCGTGPNHIRAVAAAVKVAGAQRRATENTSTVSVLKEQDRAPRPSMLDRKQSAVSQALASNRKIYSMEILPPKGVNTEKITADLEVIAQSGKFSFVNIPDGARASTRVSSLHLAAKVQRDFLGRLNVIPHFTTRDRNLIALQSDLLGAWVNGVHDVLLVTGDPPKLGNNRDATAVYDIDSIGLTYLVDSLNRGTSPLGENLGGGTGFGIGVAVNPTAQDLDVEESRWKFKLESGADFGVTQPIFDADSYLRWIEKIGAQFYRPHLVGIWPLVSLRNAEFMANEVPGIHVPKWVLEEMEKAGDSLDEAKKRGIEIAQKVMKRLEDSSAGFCISAPLGRVSVALEVVQ